MRKFVLRNAVTVLAFATAVSLTSAADAAAYLFTLSGPNAAVFALDSSPTPAAAGNGYFTLANIAGTYNGSPATFADLTFFSTGATSGGFLASSGGSALIDLEGAQLFSGTTASPTFTLGTFNLDDGFYHAYTLSITAAAVPEPASWLMMLLGFTTIALAIRRRSASPCAQV